MKTHHDQVFSNGDRFTETSSLKPMPCRGLRIALCGFGWLNIALGTAGMFLPLLPTTVFLLIALWAFSRSSLRFHVWLYNHPLLGRTIREWHDNRAIPRKAKVLALASIVASMLWVTLFVADDWKLPLVLSAALTPIAGYIVTRPASAAPPGVARALTRADH